MNRFALLLCVLILFVAMSQVPLHSRPVFKPLVEVEMDIKKGFELYWVGLSANQPSLWEKLQLQTLFEYVRLNKIFSDLPEWTSGNPQYSDLLIRFGTLLKNNLPPKLIFQYGVIRNEAHFRALLVPAHHNKSVEELNNYSEKAIQEIFNLRKNPLESPNSNFKIFQTKKRGKPRVFTAQFQNKGVLFSDSPQPLFLTEPFPESLKFDPAQILTLKFDIEGFTKVEKPKKIRLNIPSWSPFSFLGRTQNLRIGLTPTHLQVSIEGTEKPFFSTQFRGLLALTKASLPALESKIGGIEEDFQPFALAAYRVFIPEMLGWMDRVVIRQSENWGESFIFPLPRWLSNPNSASSEFNLVLAGVIGALIIPEIKVNREVWSKKSCVENMKILQEALKPGKGEEKTLPHLDLLILQKRGKMITIPRCPSGGHYITRDIDTGGLQIECTRHGSRPF